MKNVLYIGNALSSKGKTVTSVEVLSEFLRETCNVKIASSKSNKFLRLLDMMWLLLKNRSKADFVLIDTYSTINFYYALIIAILCKWLKIKYIPILRGGNLEKRLKQNPRMSKILFNSAFKLVGPSAFMEYVFKEYGYDNIVYIPNTIDIENYKFYNRSIDKIKLLWVRSFNEIYNPQMAISVLKKLIEFGHDAELTMVGPEGDGSLFKTQELAKKENLNVVFTGKLSKKQWIDLSGKNNIFINTTNFDNTPVSVIEAMALGLPIVSTNVGGLPYLIADETDGVLVPPCDVESMVDKIIYLKENASIKDMMVVKARKKVEYFDWKSVKPKWESLLS